MLGPWQKQYDAWKADPTWPKPSDAANAAAAVSVDARGYQQRYPNGTDSSRQASKISPDDGKDSNLLRLAQM